MYISGRVTFKYILKVHYIHILLKVEWMVIVITYENVLYC